MTQTEAFQSAFHAHAAVAYACERRCDLYEIASLVERAMDAALAADGGSIEREVRTSLGLAPEAALHDHIARAYRRRARARALVRSPG